ncbi:MAG: PLDc N-terminal domain-containing protein, partial [Planctomycetia bacterium]
MTADSTWLAFLISFAAHDLIVLVLVPIVIMRRKEPAAATAWILAILLVPLLGATAYL